MARTPDYIVKRGDSLWKIATDHASKIAGSTTQAKINTLVSVNGIKNPNLIYVGQNIYFSGSAAGNTTSSSATQNSNAVKIDGFGLQAGSTTGRDMFAHWTWTRENTKHYRVRWEWYVNGHKEWETFEIEEPYHNKSGIPQEASYAQVFILPVAKNKLNSKGEDTGVPYWSDAVETGKQYQFSENPPLPPERPNLEPDPNNGLKITASISNIDPTELDAVSVQFNLVRDNSVSLGITNPVPIIKDSHYVAHQYDVETGHTYMVRARTVSAKGKESGWSDFSDASATKPSAPIILEDKCRLVKRDDGSIAAHIEWEAASTATSYKIEYVTTKTDFETTPDNIQSVTTDTARTSIEIIIDKIGLDYYFRVKAINKDNMASDPSAIAHVPIGTIPTAPATWSTSDSAFVGDNMELHWTHNSEDRSKQTFATLDLNINSGGWVTVGTFENTTDADDEKIDEVSYAYGKSVSYKGTLYFKMDTNADALRDTTILWRVRTKGIIDEPNNGFGDWSVESTIHIYEKPTLALSMTSDIAGTGPLITTLTSFPFYVRAKDSLVGSKVQKPVGYHLQITSNEYYNTVDDVGRMKTVSAGDVVYSKYFSTSEELIVEMSANNVDLESGINYTLYCMEDMSTGLTITNQHDFTVNWMDAEYPISANIIVDPDSYSALITPYCAEKIPVGPGGKNLLKYPYINSTATVNGITFTDIGDGGIVINGTATDRSIYMLHELGGNYTGIYTVSGGVSNNIKATCEAYSQENKWLKNATVNKDYSCTIVTDNNKLKVFIDISSGTTVNNVTIYPQLELGYKATAYEQYYAIYEDGDLINDLTLSVYRREYDGTFTEVASGVPNNYTAVTDPHPALDYARYRFVAKDILTGAISFYDMDGYPVNCSSIILQWDEEWSTFDSGEEQTIEGLPWSGSLLKLPYNIKVTDNRKPEVAMVEYAGRRHPVSYYGTQVGETSTWNTDIPKDDKETVYALRRLSLWTGDVYVREPSGMGYWANVEVSFNQSYNEVTIPVSLNITRVEGGV